MYRSICIKVTIPCSEIGKLRESKRSFDRTAEDFNSALHKNAQSPKSKPAEAEEVSVCVQTNDIIATDVVTTQLEKPPNGIT